MSRTVEDLRPGDVIEVRSEAEILETLDDQGSLDGLPFMPEMLRFCGLRFRVLRRIEKTCCEKPAMEMRRFRGGAVVSLEDLRCSGAEHGACQNGCTIFWKSAWLRKVHTLFTGVDIQRKNGCTIGVGDYSGLIVLRENGNYSCQSSELMRATFPLSWGGKIAACFRDLKVRNYALHQMLTLIARPAVRKILRRFRGEWPCGVLRQTPVEVLDLQPGEWVQVKPLAEIVSTLDRAGKNRGLHFSEDMVSFCGGSYQVRNRLDRMMMEATGELRELQNTVILEGVRCGCPFTFGGCPRGSFLYWREAWLNRVPEP